MNSGRKLRVADLGIVDYDTALTMQTELREARIADQIDDTLLLLEHPHVYTLGRGADERFIVARPEGIPVRRVSRGGQVTYHGPGQLIGYPILKLDGQARDVANYLRKLERAIIEALARFEIEANLRQGLTGVWVGTKKIASIGVGIRRWTTYHGFAVNVATDLEMFDAIVPCGIDGCEMTSIAALGNRGVSIDSFKIAMRESFCAVFGYESTIIPRAAIDSSSVRTENRELNG
jgi:lipoate-protein ligase B